MAYIDVATSSDNWRKGARYAFKSASGDYTPAYWPWSAESFKPGADESLASRKQELTKAGALIAAEIDYLSNREETK